MTSSLLIDLPFAVKAGMSNDVNKESSYEK